MLGDPPADENRWLSALGNEYSDVGGIVLHTGVGEIPWPTLPVTTQINGIRWPSLLRECLLPEPQTAAEFAEPRMRMRGGWSGIVSGSTVDTASIAQAS